MRTAALTIGAALLLAGCDSSAPEQEAESTEIPAELAAAPAAAEAAPADGEVQIGTPMAERVATLGLLNKRNNITQDITLKPGESRRIGDVVIRLAACERTAPWETVPEMGAFVQLSIRERADADAEFVWKRVFSGWLFRNSPGLNPVEHPVYDVWVKDCAMSFPGEEEALRVAGSGRSSAASTSAPAASEPPSAEAPVAAAPAPAATPSAAPAADSSAE